MKRIISYCGSILLFVFIFSFLLLNTQASAAGPVISLGTDVANPISSISAVSSSSKTSNIVLLVADIKSNSDFVLKSLKLDLYTDGAEVSKLFSDVKIRVGSQVYSYNYIDNLYPNTVSSTTVTFSNLSISLPKDATIPITVLVDVSPYFRKSSSFSAYARIIANDNSIVANDYAGNRILVSPTFISGNKKTFIFEDQPVSESPVISGLTAPTVLSVGQLGTWTIQASDQNNGPLSYSVKWGDEGRVGLAGSIPFVQTSTFTHTYSVAGTYRPTFTVRNSAGLSAETGATVQVGSSTNCYVFAMNLMLGDIGSDVSALQSFLIAKGYSLPSIQFGSTPKGYFGKETQSAVMAYQSSIGIPSTGFVGPLTRNSLNASSCGIGGDINTTNVTVSNTKVILGAPIIYQGVEVVMYPVTLSFTINNGRNSPIYVSAAPSDVIDLNTANGPKRTDLIGSFIVTPEMLAGDSGKVFVIPSGSSRSFTTALRLNNIGGTAGPKTVKVIGISFLNGPEDQKPSTITSGLSDLRLFVDMDGSATSTKPYITVLSPKGGEVYSAGQEITIKYSVNNFPRPVNIAIQLNKGAVYPGGPFKPVSVIASGYLPATGVYKFKIPTDIGEGNDYSLLISSDYPTTETSGDNEGYSNNFTIRKLVVAVPTPNSTPVANPGTGSQSIRVLSPKGGDTLVIGKEYKIQFDSNVTDFNYYSINLKNKYSGSIGMQIASNINAVKSIGVPFVLTNGLVEGVIANSPGKTATQIKDDYYIEILAMKPVYLNSTGAFAGYSFDISGRSDYFTISAQSQTNTACPAGYVCTSLNPTINYVQAPAAYMNQIYAGQRAVVYGANLNTDVSVRLLGKAYEENIQVYNKTYNSADFIVPSNISSGTYTISLIYKAGETEKVQVQVIVPQLSTTPTPYYTPKPTVMYTPVPSTYYYPTPTPTVYYSTIPTPTPTVYYSVKPTPTPTVYYSTVPTPTPTVYYSVKPTPTPTVSSSPKASVYVSPTPTPTTSSSPKASTSASPSPKPSTSPTAMSDDEARLQASIWAAIEEYFRNR